MHRINHISGCTNLLNPMCNTTLLMPDIYLWNLNMLDSAPRAKTNEESTILKFNMRVPWLCDQ